MRDPRTHEVGDGAVDAELVVEGPDGGDGPVVDVGDQAQGLVEGGIVLLVEPPEEAGRKAVLVEIATTHGAAP